MKRKTWLLGLFLCVLIIALTLASNADESRVEAEIENFSGSVEILRGPWWKFWGWEEVEMGQSLYAADRLHVGDDSSLDLLFHDESQLRVLEKTTVIIKESEYISSEAGVQLAPIVELKKGELLIKVEKSLSKLLKFKVETPNAVAGVRGTLFGVKARWNTTTVTVTEGQVAVQQKKTGEEIAISPGFLTKVVGSKKPSEPTAATEKELKKLKEWKKEIQRTKGDQEKIPVGQQEGTDDSLDKESKEKIDHAKNEKKDKEQDKEKEKKKDESGQSGNDAGNKGTGEKNPGNGDSDDDEDDEPGQNRGDDEDSGDSDDSEDPGDGGHGSDGFDHEKPGEGDGDGE